MWIFPRLSTRLSFLLLRFAVNRYGLQSVRLMVKQTHPEAHPETRSFEYRQGSPFGYAEGPERSRGAQGRQTSDEQDLVSVTWEKRGYEQARPSAWNIILSDSFDISCQKWKTPPQEKTELDKNL